MIGLENPYLVIIQTVVYLFNSLAPHILLLLPYTANSDLYLRATKMICSESPLKYILSALPGLPRAFS